MFDLGGFDSKPEWQPWLALSLRFGTDRPVSVGKVAWVSGYVEGFVFPPGLEYPATPGASPDDLPVIRFGRDGIVNARYEIELNGKIQAKWKYLDRLFLFAAPKFFFGDASLDNRNSWSAAPLTMLLESGVGDKSPSIPSCASRTPSSRISAMRRMVLSASTGAEFLCVGFGKEHASGRRPWNRTVGQSYRLLQPSTSAHVFDRLRKD